MAGLMSNNRGRCKWWIKALQQILAPVPQTPGQEIKGTPGAAEVVEHNQEGFQLIDRVLEAVGNRSRSAN